MKKMQENHLLLLGKTFELYPQYKGILHRHCTFVMLTNVLLATFYHYRHVSLGVLRSILVFPV